MKRIISFFTAAVITAAIVAPCTYAENTYIYLQTAADVKDFADKCTIDSYSVDKVAVLQSDIDLSTVDFTGIPYMNGTLDGAGHTISGVKLEVSNPERGFVGTIGETGVVKNLTVEGSITEKEDNSGDSSESNTNRILKVIENLTDEKGKTAIDRFVDTDSVNTVGGIAGVNKGMITDCKYKGTLKGMKNVGGIAGNNEGRIEASANYASVIGTMNTGGIAGKNSGVIKWCNNYGRINNNADEEMYATGGICGYSEGAISASYNNATIGYRYAGSATGGIVGAQSGHVSECTNDGAVLGKRRVGGIVGNFEPYANITYNPDEWSDRIDEQKDKLRNDLDDLESRIDNNRDKIKGDLDDWDSRWKDVFGLSDLGSSIGDGISDAGDGISSAGKSLEKASDKLSDASGKIADAIGDVSDDLGGTGNSLVDAVSDALSDANDSVSDALSDANDSTSDVTRSLRDLNDAINNKVSNSTSLSDAADSLSRSVDVLRDMQSDLSDNQGDVIDFIREMRNTASTMSDVTRDISDSVTSGNDRIMDLVDSINNNVSDQERRDKLNETLDAINDSLDSTSKALDAMADWNVDMDLGDIRMPDVDIRVFDDVDDELARVLRRAFDNDYTNDIFSSITKSFSEAIKALKERQEKLEELKKQIEDELNKFATFMPTFTREPAATLLPAETKEPEPTYLPVVTQEPRAWNPFVKTAYAADDDDDKSTLERLLDLDIHDIDIPLEETICDETFELALVKYCVNSGEITGSNDIGGISGGVGFETGIGNGINISHDGEDFSLDPSTAVKSVISACINEGNVTAKSNSAGGVTGFSDLGKIKDSINSGDIEVSEGKYSGGISGYNLNDVMRCINTGDVNAESDIGGITGYGTNISQTYSLTRTSSEGERIGAIAGTAGGDLEHNYFLKEKLGGINGVDYSDKAEPVDKDVLARDGEIASELSGLEDRYWVGVTGEKYMPQLRALAENDAANISDTLKAKSAGAARFTFTANFIVDGESVKSINLQYGETIPQDQIPEMPKRDGQYGSWSRDTSEPIIRNTKFIAEYNKSKASLGYGGEPPQVLVEGDFNPNSSLEVTEFNPAAVINDDKYNALYGYEMKVVDNGVDYDGDLKVRVRVPKENSENYKVGLITESSVVIADAERDGSYLVFNPDGADRFIVLEQKPSPLKYILIGGGILLLLFILFLCRKRIKERRLLNKIREISSKINLPELAAEYPDDEYNNTEDAVKEALPEKTGAAELENAAGVEETVKTEDQAVIDNAAEANNIHEEAEDKTDRSEGNIPEEVQ